MSKYLVDFLQEQTQQDTSVLRREIVEGHIRVNGVAVEDPATKLTDEYSIPSRVEYNGRIYTYPPSQE